MCFSGSYLPRSTGGFSRAASAGHASHSDNTEVSCSGNTVVTSVEEASGKHSLKEVDEEWFLQTVRAAAANCR